MLREGTTIGAYRIVRLVRRSTSPAQVYQAQSLRDGTIVALKTVPLTIDESVISAETTGASLQDQFERAHGLVPKIFAVGEDDHYFFIAMEFIDAPTLLTSIQRGASDAATAARHAVEICDFLEKAHTFATRVGEKEHTGIIHGDLKPEHVFVLDNGGIKVLDFGIAKALQTHKTATTIAGFTPAYAPPGRIDTTRANEKDDLWAL